MEVVACFALTSAVLPTVLSAVVAAVVTAAGIDQLVDFGVALVFGRGHHWHRQLPLGSVTCLHDLADAQTAVLSGNVRLLTISGRLNRCKRRWRLVGKGEVVQGWELHTVVEELRAEAR